MAGLLSARLPEVRLEKVSDPRSWARCWSVEQILTAVLLGLLAGCRSLVETERLTATLSPAMRRMLGLGRRMADTTMRDLLCRLDLGALRQCLHRLVRVARRRKALKKEVLPFHVVSMDGKVTSLPYFDQEYVQRHVPEHGLPFGLVRTVTCTLVSAPGRPCIDAIPLPARTNEIGHFREGFAELMKAYPDLFQVVTYDAGALSEANGRAVVEAGKDYLFRLRGEARTMYKLADELIDPDEVVGETVDVLDCRTTVTRRVILLPIEQQWSYGAGKKPAESVWRHARTFVRIESEVTRDGEAPQRETRLYVTSLPAASLTPQQWLHLVRSHWGVENNTHHTLDTAFAEDDRPWITRSGVGTLAVLLLRRIALTLLTLFRSVTQRSEEKRRMPWKALLSWVRDTLVAATFADIDGLRRRALATD